LCALARVGFPEPFTSLLNQGMVLMHGHAMSKSRGNLVEPSELIDEHGADVARLTMLFAGPFEDDVDWGDGSPAGMAGVGRGRRGRRTGGGPPGPTPPPPASPTTWSGSASTPPSPS